MGEEPDRYVVPESLWLLYSICKTRALLTGANADFAGCFSATRAELAHSFRGRD